MAETKNSDELEPLPDYERPPLVEAIVGVQFDRLPIFKNGHLGVFWKTLSQEKWPAIADAPLLPPLFERFAESAKWAEAGAQFMLTQDPTSRLQIKNKGGDQMIQIQNGRLHFNWLGEAQKKYPRYDAVREGFVNALEGFIRFIEQEKLDSFRPNQWEVTYLNHIVKGTVWHAPSDWTFFRPLGNVPSVHDMILGESFHGEWSFVIPPDRGRLHVQWQHGLRGGPEQKEVVILTLTARGPLDPHKPTVDSVLEGLDLGHETIVRSFKKLMSPEANQYWGLKNGHD